MDHTLMKQDMVLVRIRVQNSWVLNKLILIHRKLYYTLTYLISYM